MGINSPVMSEGAGRPLEPERPVLVTGFGPFGHHKVNASWAAVCGLKKLGVEYKSTEVALETREIPVAYDIVSSVVPQLYERFNPRLCVHVGVSPYKVEPSTL